MHSFLLYQILIQEILSDKQQLTILWQCPKFIGYEKLELVYLITDFLHLWSYRVVICYCLLALALYLVGYLAGIYQCLYTTLYCLGALGYLWDASPSTEQWRSSVASCHVRQSYGIHVRADLTARARRLWK